MLGKKIHDSAWMASHYKFIAATEDFLKSKLSSGCLYTEALDRSFRERYVFEQLWGPLFRDLTLGTTDGLHKIERMNNVR